MVFAVECGVLPVEMFLKEEEQKEGRD